MAESPRVSDNFTLPIPEDNREVQLFNSLRYFFTEVRDVIKFLIQRNWKAVTAAYTVQGSDYFISGDATSATFAVTLPPVAPFEGREFVIKKIDSSGNAVTVDSADTEEIDGTTSYSLSNQYDAIRIISDGSNWHVI